MYRVELTRGAATSLVIFREPGMQRVLIDPEISGGLGYSLIGLKCQFDSSLFKRRTVWRHFLFAHWNDLTSCLGFLVSRCPVKCSQFTISESHVRGLYQRSYLPLLACH